MHHSLGSAGWLVTQALPLLISPRVIVSLLSSEPRNATGIYTIPRTTLDYNPAAKRTSDLETYFARALAFALFSLSFLSLQLSGVIPATSIGDSDTTYVLPTLITITTYHGLTGIYQYVYWSQGGTASVGLGGLINGGLVVMGIWCMLFSTDKGHISKRTGADKRTSSLWFKNDVAEERKAGRKRL